MKSIARTSIFVFLSVLNIACHASQEVENEFVVSQNVKYSLEFQLKLDVEFYKNFPLKSDEKYYFAEKMSLKEIKADKIIDIRALDSNSLKSSKGYFLNVWSPDQEYFIVPLGPFDGFAIYNSNSAWEELKKGEYTNTIKLKLKGDSPAIWHEFIGWVDDSTVVLKAGRGKKLKTFYYNIGSNSIKGYPAYEALTKRGVIPIYSE